VKPVRSNKQLKFTYVALVSQILFVRALYHLLQRLVVDVAQLECRGFRVESNAIKDVRKPGTPDVSGSSDTGMTAIWSLFVLSPFAGASDVLPSFRDGRTRDGVVRIPEIQTLIATWPVSDEHKDGHGTP